MAYGATRESAVAAVRAVALRVAADCIDRGEEIPEPLTKVFSGAMSRWKSVKARQLLAALLRIGWDVFGVVACPTRKTLTENRRVC